MQNLSNRAAAATCFHPPPIQYAYAIKVKKICNGSLISRGMEKGLREKVILRRQRGIVLKEHQASP